MKLMTVIEPLSAEKNYARKLGQDGPIYLIMLKVCIQNIYQAAKKVCAVLQK